MFRVRQPTKRTVYLMLAAVTVASVLVWFSGIRHPRGPRTTPVVTAVRSQLDVAPTNAALGRGRNSHNRARQPAALAALSAGLPVVTDALPHDEAAWQADRKRRADTRAYDGAPPVIPHPIDQRGYPSCLTCHERGARIANRIAPVMSHEKLTSCTQCHAAVTSTVPVTPNLAASVATESSFLGLEPAGKGARAWPGAPPVIPHSTWMRERCSSCHGALSTGLHTSHAQRQSCTQCHGLSAALDQKSAIAIAHRPSGAAQ